MIDKIETHTKEATKKKKNKNMKRKKQLVKQRL